MALPTLVGSKNDVDSSFLQRYAISPNSEVILDALEHAHFVESNRKNVRPLGSSEPIYGMCLGLTGNWTGHEAIINKNTMVFKELARLLCAFARRELPDFAFTSIQVNKNYAAALHVDGHDAGDCYIIALGNFVGGELWVANEHPLGYTVDIRDRWFKFQGNSPHAVFPFKGCRYSLVYFTRRAGGDIGADPQCSMARTLFELGFPKVSTWNKNCLDLARPQWQRCLNLAQKYGGAGRVLLCLRMPDGHLQWIALKPTTPLGEIATAVKQRHEAVYKDVLVSVEIKVNKSRVKPNDTIKSLDLPHKQVLDVSFVEPSRSSAPQRKRHATIQANNPPKEQRQQRPNLLADSESNTKTVILKSRRSTCSSHQRGPTVLTHHPEDSCPSTPKRKSPASMQASTPPKKPRQQPQKPLADKECDTEAFASFDGSGRSARSSQQISSIELTRHTEEGNNGTVSTSEKSCPSTPDIKKEASAELAQGAEEEITVERTERYLAKLARREERRARRQQQKADEAEAKLARREERRARRQQQKADEAEIEAILAEHEAKEAEELAVANELEAEIGTCISEQALAECESHEDVQISRQSDIQSNPSKQMVTSTSMNSEERVPPHPTMPCEQMVASISHDCSPSKQIVSSTPKQSIPCQQVMSTTTTSNTSLEESLPPELPKDTTFVRTTQQSMPDSASQPKIPPEEMVDSTSQPSAPYKQMVANISHESTPSKQMLASTPEQSIPCQQVINTTMASTISNEKLPPKLTKDITFMDTSQQSIPTIASQQEIPSAQKIASTPQQGMPFKQRLPSTPYRQMVANISHKSIPSKQMVVSTAEQSIPCKRIVDSTSQQTTFAEKLMASTSQQGMPFKQVGNHFIQACRRLGVQTWGSWSPALTSTNSSSPFLGPKTEIPRDATLDSSPALASTTSSSSLHPEAKNPRKGSTQKRSAALTSTKSSFASQVPKAKIPRKDCSPPTPSKKTTPLPDPKAEDSPKETQDDGVDDIEAILQCLREANDDAEAALNAEMELEDEEAEEEDLQDDDDDDEDYVLHDGSSSDY